MKSRKFGFTLVETMIVIVIIGFLAAIAIPSFQKARETHLKKNIPLGYLIPEPAEGMAYTITAVDSNSNAVIAVPHDRYYTTGTLHRVLLKVNENVKFVGATFARSKNDQRDHLVVPFANFQIDGWVEVETTTAH